MSEFETIDNCDETQFEVGSVSGQHEVPNSWQWATMSESCEKIQDGTHFSPDQHKQLPFGIYPYVTAKNVRPAGLDLTNLTYLEESEHRMIYERCDPKTGDVLLVKDGVNMGDAAINTFEGEISLLSSVCMLRPRKHVLAAEFLRYYILSPQGFQSLTGQMTGTAIKRVILRKIRETPVPVAPLNEQRRIVSKIEELFSDLDAGVAALKRAKANLKRYRAAVLKAAVEGKLTEEWRAKHPTKEPASALLTRILKERRQKWEADQLAKFAAAGKEPPKNWRDKYVEPSPPNTSGLPELPKSWCWVNIEMVADSCLGKMLDKSKHLSGTRLPYLRNTNVRWGSFMVTDLLEMYFKDDELERFSLLEGDVLVCEGGEPGRCAVWGNQIEGMKFQKALHRVRCSDGLQPWYLTYFLEHMAKSLRLEQYFTGTTIKHFTGESFAKVPIPLPPFIEQQQIVEEVAEKLSQIEALDSEIEHGLLRAARLRQSILKQAFEGKLVPQDPKDEAASVLLDRLRASRSAHEVNGKAATPARTRGRRAKSKQVSLPGEEGER